MPRYSAQRTSPPAATPHGMSAANHGTSHPIFVRSVKDKTRAGLDAFVLSVIDPQRTFLHNLQFGIGSRENPRRWRQHHGHTPPIP
jgi:hypothetical protein